MNKFAILLGRGPCAHYGRGPKSPLTIRFALIHTSAEAPGPIRNQASEPVATAPLSAAMIHSSQDILPILLLGVCERAAAAPEFDSSAGAIVSVLAAVTTVAASLASAPCASVARSMSLAWSGEAHPHGLAIDHKFARQCRYLRRPY